ncbi:hypothetical protein ACFQ3S_15845 [Mucilaginibacter terrae]|uniref:hypothetical protein n=1 Tax=Mucilaginibacter terrae TaxID=1955052 RepID=UPI003631D7AE
MKKIFFARPYRFIFFPLAAAAFLSLISFIVMHLWNYLLPGLLHVDMITFWQAMALFVLCKILFGFGGRGKFGGGAPCMRQKMEERLKHMSPEEQQRFKEQFSNRMCHKSGHWGRRDWFGEEAKQEDKKAD